MIGSGEGLLLLLLRRNSRGPAKARAQSSRVCSWWRPRAPSQIRRSCGAWLDALAQESEGSPTGGMVEGSGRGC